MFNNVVFDNRRFVITVEALADPIELAGALFYSAYFVINKETGVTEVKTPGLVEAIMYAENSDRMLETKPWEWARQAQAIADAEAAGSPTLAN